MPAPQTTWEQSVDRAMRSCSRVFGEGLDEAGGPRVLYQHFGAASAYAVDGIFEATTESVDLETGATVMSHEPRVSLALSELTQAPAVDDLVTIRGKVYRVIEPMFDGQGTATLRLHVVGAAP